jgi:hypothetical protein
VSNPSGIILRTVESGFFSAPPRAHPSNIYVVSYNDGRVKAFSGVPSAGDRWGSRFCYIVDTAERRVRNSFTVPTSIDAYSFTIEVEATWKVTDPEAVVRANLTDGNEVVLARLQDELWVIGREFQPDNAVGAERAARSALSTLKNLDEGVTILRSTARFQVDTRLTTAVLERDQDTHQGSRDEQKMQNLRGLVEGSDDGMILLHLMQHPDDTGTVLQMMADARDRNQSVQLGLLDRMLEHNLITDADAQPLRDSVLGRTIAPTVKMRPITPRTTPAALTPATTSQAIPSAASPAPDPARAPAPAPSAPVSAPAKKVHVVGDGPVPTQPKQPVQPGPLPPPNPAPSAGGVKKWKSLKKDPDQEPE